MAELDQSARTALRGLRENIDRMGDVDSIIASMSTGQALFWMCALDERLEASPGYKVARNQDPRGRVLPALRLARNAYAHGAAVIMFGAMVADGYPGVVIRGPRWASYESVREGLDRDPARDRQLLWRKCVEGRNAMATLSMTAEWLRDAVIEHADVLAPRERGASG